jgi:hypothetical protein
MATAKQIVREIAETLTEQATLEDAMHTLYLRQKLERSLQAAKDGDVISQEDMERQFIQHGR